YITPRGSAFPPLISPINATRIRRTTLGSRAPRCSREYLAGVHSEAVHDALRSPDPDPFTPCRPAGRGSGPASERFHALGKMVDPPALGGGIWRWPAPHRLNVCQGRRHSYCKSTIRSASCIRSKNFAFGKRSNMPLSASRERSRLGSHGEN